MVVVVVGWRRCTKYLWVKMEWQEREREERVFGATTAKRDGVER
jgi:hypothetical protein